MRTTPLIRCPFLVAVDSAETHSWSFDGISTDADKEYCEWDVRQWWMSLGRYPYSYGDYSIVGLEKEVAIERKGLEDVWGTVLGWETDAERERQLAGRRERFEQELDNLASLKAACVVVEADWHTTLSRIPAWGEKPDWVNRKIFFRSIISFQQRFHVPWNFMPDRRTAEVFAFRWLERHWKKLPKDRQKELQERYVSLSPEEDPPF